MFFIFWLLFSFLPAFQFSVTLIFPTLNTIFSGFSCYIPLLQLAILVILKFLISLVSVPHISLVALLKYWQNAFQEPGRCSMHPDTLFHYSPDRHLHSLNPFFLPSSYLG